MMRHLNYLPRGCAFLIGWLLLVYGCEDQCYKQGITSTNLQRDESDVVVDGVCYSTCALTDTSFDTLNFSSLNCTQRVMLNGCVAGCNHSRHPSLLNECQLKCSSCINGSETTSTECNECDFTTCMVGCNSTINFSRSRISLGSTNITLVPVPGKPYVYKAKIQISNDFQNTSIARSNSGPFAYIVRVSSLDSNVTSHSLLYNPSTDVVDLTQYSAHCQSANISVAVINSEGISEYSSSTEMCITAFYPQAATNLQSCFGEEVGFNVSRKFIINLQWELPKDVTYLEGFMLSIVPESRRRCKTLDVITLKRDQTKYTVGQILNGCDYQISLISMPRYSDNNTIVVTQSTERICAIPDYNDSLIQQFNINGTSNYIIHVFLESDPAALQALQYFRIIIDGYSTEYKLAYKFPSYLFPAKSTGLEPECFSDKQNRHYTCSDNCNSLQYNGTDHERCIEECEDASEYSIALNQSFPSSQNLSMTLSFLYKPEYRSYRCRYLQRRINTGNAECRPPTAPRNLRVLSNSTQTGILVVNLTWILPELTYGHITHYVVEFYFNDTTTTLEKTTENNEPTLKDEDIGQYTIIRVRADNGCNNYTWSNNLLIDPVDFFPPKQSSSNDPPYHRYYIASGVIVGFIAFAAVVLAVIVICLCYVHKEREKSTIIIDKSIVGPGTPMRSANNRRSDLFENNHIPIPVDLWEISPDNILLDDSTFLARGNFGQVYRGELATATKSPNESYTAGTHVAVKILQEDAGGDLKYDFLQEISVMKKVAEGSNPFVVNMVGCSTTNEPLALVMEFVPCGNLLEFLKRYRRKPSQEMNKDAAPYLEPSNEYSHLKPQQIINEEKKSLNVAELITFAYQIACGMEYLGGKGIIHRDLACRNILVGDNNTMKITDFGLSKHLYDDPVYVQNQDGKLPIRWMAIEAILEQKFSVQSDVWSFGIVIWELFTFGDYPYPSLTNYEVVDALLKGYRMECPSNYLCPPKLYALVERCWYADPEQRPSFNTLSSEISNMIPDYDPNRYVEVAGCPPYCETHPSNSQTVEKGGSSFENVNSVKEDTV